MKTASDYARLLQEHRGNGYSTRKIDRKWAESVTFLLIFERGSPDFNSKSTQISRIYRYDEDESVV